MLCFFLSEEWFSIKAEQFSVCLGICAPALRFGSEILKCSGITEDTLNVHQDLPHPNPALLHPVVQTILHPHLVEGLETTVMDRGQDMGGDQATDLGMDMDMITVMGMVIVMVMVMVLGTDMDTDTDMDMITVMDMDMDMNMDMVHMGMGMGIMVMVMGITDTVMVIMDMVIMVMVMATGTSMATCMGIVIRKEGSVTGPPAAPAAATLTRGRYLDWRRKKTT